jgi:hypothetical protein
MNSIWSEKTVERLKEYWPHLAMSKTKIAAELSREFGRQFTKNAVSGKAHKLKLLRRDGELQEAQQAAAREAAAKEKGSIAIMVERFAEGTKKRPSGLDLEVPDQAFLCTTVALTNESCRYPVGIRGAYKHCGFPEANETRNIPYCAYHARLCGTFYRRAS